MRQELLLAVVGAMFVAEALSVMIQVGFFKLSKGRRVFRCAPLHHHFQFGGMSEVKVTLRFWLLAGVFAALGLTAFAWPTLGGEAVPEVADVEEVAEPTLVMRK
jgi:phospho-N-acetylmuramoyl-pentapeptide-transferase